MLMEAPVEIRSSGHHPRTDATTLPALLNSLSLFALWISIAMLALAFVTATDTPYIDEFLNGRGSEGILPIMFVIVSTLTLGFYVSFLTLEPVMLPAWGPPSRIVVVVRTFLFRNLWTLVCRIGKLCGAFLLGEIHPHRDPDEAIGLRSVAIPDTSPRFIHRWLPGTSPSLVYH